MRVHICDMNQPKLYNDQSIIEKTHEGKTGKRSTRLMSPRMSLSPRANPRMSLSPRMSLASPRDKASPRLKFPPRNRSLRSPREKGLDDGSECGDEWAPAGAAGAAGVAGVASAGATASCGTGARARVTE